MSGSLVCEKSIYSILYTRLGEKVTHYSELTPTEKDACRRNFKLSILRNVLGSAIERINQVATISAFARTKPTEERRKSVFIYRVDHHEYRGTIYKNLRDNDTKESYELHLSNDGFGYKDMNAPDFKKIVLKDPMNRAGSSAWVQLPSNYTVELQTELKAIATTFTFDSQYQPELYYNSDILRMEFHFIEANKELIVILETGFPEFTPTQRHQELTYDQIRDQNMRVHQASGEENIKGTDFED